MKSLDEMTENQKNQLTSIDELRLYHDTYFKAIYPIIPEDTELCILLRTLLDDYINNAVKGLRGDSTVRVKEDNLRQAACLIISKYSYIMYSTGDLSRHVSFGRLKRHVLDTFDDKYEHSLINPMDYILTDYGFAHTIICTLKYISRYFASEGRKTKNVLDLLKALHYLIIEDSRV